MSLENIHAGDTLIQCDSHGRRTITKVERETHTQLITPCGTRYRKKDGRKVGRRGVWDWGSLREPHVGEIEEIHKARRHRKLEVRITNAVTRRKLETMSLKQLEKLYSVLQEFQNDGDKTDQG
jgi:hypothetical protein